MHVLSKTWDFWVSAILAIVFALWVSKAVWSNISTELITFFGIQAATVLPVMIFAAGLLRPEGVTLNEARQYRGALMAQMKFWITILALDFISVILIISGKAANWDIPLSVPFISVDVNAGGVLSVITAFFVSLTCFRMIPIVRGIMSLQTLHADLTEKAIIKENRTLASTYREGRPTTTTFRTPEGYGRVVNPRTDQQSD